MIYIISDVMCGHPWWLETNCSRFGSAVGTDFSQIDPTETCFGSVLRCVRVDLIEKKKNVFTLQYLVDIPGP